MIIMSNPFKDLQTYFDALPDVSNKAAMLALNEVTKKQGLAILRDEMNAEVNFPENYVKRNTERSQAATQHNLTAVITGRGRATSLAEFVVGGSFLRSRLGPVGVKVKNQDASVSIINNARLINLNNGNTGLAVWVPKGKPLHGSYGAVKLNSKGARRNQKYDIYLLYGPSVDQVLGGAFDKRADEVGEMLVNEFIRQFGRLSNG